MTEAIQLPYFLSDFEGIGGRIKQRPEDFFVQEIPLYEPTGDGDHVMAEIQKVGVSTFDACDYIARQLNVDRRGIGYAGMKDAQMVRPSPGRSSPSPWSRPKP
jgi:tRNA pseudouridine13 synthase